MTPPLNKENPRILITRTDRIGDLVLSTPVFSEIKKKYPEAYVAAMCLPGTREVLEGNSYIDELILYDKRGKYKHWWQSFQFGWSLRKKKFDLAIHLHPTNRVHILSFLAGISIRIGYRRNFGFLLTHSIPEEKAKGEKHEAEYNFDLLKSLDIPLPSSLELSFHLGDNDLQHFESFIQAEGIRLEDSSFVINPSASCPSKRWPPERFSRLADFIAEKHHMNPILIGDKEGVSFSNQVQKNMKSKPVDLTGKLSLKDVGVLFTKVQFLISNDTGPVHIAVALNLPVISIFGRLDPGLSPKRWRPLGQKSFYLHDPPDCHPCLAHNCKIDFECLTNIQMEDVVNLLETNREIFALT